MLAGVETKKVRVRFPRMPRKFNDRIRIVKSVMASHERNGWRGSFYHVAGRSILRRYPDGSFLAEVPMVRQVDENGNPLSPELLAKSEDDRLDWDSRIMPEKTWGGPAIGRED